MAILFYMLLVFYTVQVKNGHFLRRSAGLSKLQYVRLWNFLLSDRKKSTTGNNIIRE